jgi:hypothetical protein
VTVIQQPDVRNPSGERFTQERLLSLIQKPTPSAAVQLDTIEGHLNVYIANAVQVNDISLLAVRRARASESYYPTR